MGPEVIAIIVSVVTVGVSLAALILQGLKSLRGDLAEVRAGLGAATVEIRTGLDAATAERQAIRSDLHAIGERVARLEGAFPFLLGAQAAAPTSD